MKEADLKKEVALVLKSGTIPFITDKKFLNKIQRIMRGHGFKFKRTQDLKYAEMAKHEDGKTQKCVLVLKTSDGKDVVILCERSFGEEVRKDIKVGPREYIPTYDIPELQPSVLGYSTKQ